MMRGVAALLLTESETKDMSNVRATCDAWIVGALAPPAATNLVHDPDPDASTHPGNQPASTNGK